MREEFNRPITPLDIRRQAYWTFLAGGTTSTGTTSIPHLDRWRNWIDSPGSCQLGVFRRS